MSNQEYCLSDGAIGLITEQMNDKLTPIVQILGTKNMTNNRIRAVISDGVKLCQHCIFISEEIDQMFNDGLLSKFTVVRIDQYQISSLPKKDNMSVILVNKITILKSGEEVDKKLNAGDPFKSVPEAPAAASAVSLQTNRSISNSNSGTSTAISSVQTGSNLLKPEMVCPINVISPFYNAWVIRVRVSNKSPIKTWSNAKGEGKLFSFEVCDESGEIRITAFNTECDRYFNMIEPGKVYLISKGTTKPANKRFSSTNNDNEITLNQNSIIEPYEGPTSLSSVPLTRFKFVPLSSLNNLEIRAVVDVIGVIRNVSELDTLISKKTSKELTKRNVLLVDKSLAEVELTLWNEVASNFEGQPDDILAIKCASIGEFQGRNLSSSPNSVIQLNPDIPETALLRNWYAANGNTQSFNSLSKPRESRPLSNDNRVICQVNAQTIGDGTQNQYFSFVATVQSTTRAANQFYKSCGNNGCMKKVTDDNDGLYHCPKCDRSSPNFEWRLLLSVQIADATGACWVTLFQDKAEVLLGRGTNELARMYEENQNEYAQVLNNIRFKQFFFRIGARMEEYNNEKRVRINGYKVVPTKPNERAKHLMRMIDVLSAQVKG